MASAVENLNTGHILTLSSAKCMKQAASGVIV